MDFIRFCMVGGTGFVINLSILTILHTKLDLNLFLSQVIASEIALFSNFLLHHHWTYKLHHTKKTITRLLVEFHAVSWPAILGSSLMVSFGVKVMGLSDLVALIISSAIVLFWNFLWSKYVIWKKDGSAVLKNEKEINND